MIALVDYRAGNLTSVRKALTGLAARFETPVDASALAAARGIIVPGVGHFDATTVLDATWRNAILDRVASGVPLLGICVGMQWLFEGSEEAPNVSGLGLMRGRCARLVGDPDRQVKVPHVGWNSLESTAPGSRLLRGVPADAQVYFTHSYAPPVTTDCVAITTHGQPFAAAVERDGIFGVQFHPEKSGDVGLDILRNFLDVCE